MAGFVSFVGWGLYPTILLTLDYFEPKMHKDVKIGMVLGLVLVAAGAVWLSTRSSLSVRSRLLESRSISVQETPSDINFPSSISVAATSKVIPEQNEVSDFVVYDQTPIDQAQTIKTQKFHIVAKGETLGSISSKYYGSSGKWRKIYDNNRDIIKDPNSLRPGTKLMLPD
jgi:LysM repeat protein